MFLFVRLSVSDITQKRPITFFLSNGGDLNLNADPGLLLVFVEIV